MISIELAVQRYQVMGSYLAQADLELMTQSRRRLLPRMLRDPPSVSFEVSAVRSRKKRALPVRKTLRIRLTHEYATSFVAVIRRVHVAFMSRSSGIVYRDSNSLVMIATWPL